MKKGGSVKKPLIRETYIMGGGGIIGSPASYAIPVTTPITTSITTVQPPLTN